MFLLQINETVQVASNNVTRSPPLAQLRRNNFYKNSSLLAKHDPSFTQKNNFDESYTLNKHDPGFAKTAKHDLSATLPPNLCGIYGYAKYVPMEHNNLTRPPAVADAMLAADCNSGAQPRQAKHPQIFDDQTKHPVALPTSYSPAFSTASPPSLCESSSDGEHKTLIQTNHKSQSPSPGTPSAALASSNGGFSDSDNENKNPPASHGEKVEKREQKQLKPEMSDGSDEIRKLQTLSEFDQIYEANSWFIESARVDNFKDSAYKV